MLKTDKSILHLIASAIIILLSAMAVFFLLQNERVYNKTAAYIFKNYSNNNGDITRETIPYESYSNEKMLHWDAFLYYQISENGYDQKSAGGDYIFAFFPLFPALWKLLNLTPTLILILNYLLYVLSLILIINTFWIKSPESKPAIFLLCLSAPMLVVFLIPYTEGLFMLTATICLIAVYKDNYKLYFPAAMLMAMTRPSVTIFLAALLLTEIYFLFFKTDIKNAVRSLLLKSSPIIAGTLIVSLVQLLYGSGSLVKFLEVQKYWDTSFRLPEVISDWAHEQFAINMPLTLLILPLTLAYPVYQLYRKSRIQKQTVNISESGGKEYLFILSLAFIAGNILGILLTRAGSLHGMSRYVLCTPFYIIGLLILSEKTENIKPVVLIASYVTAIFITVIAFSLTSYTESPEFPYLGGVLLFSQMAFFIFNKLAKIKWLVYLHILVNILWTTYLFNMFLSNAWIFA